MSALMLFTRINLLESVTCTYSRPSIYAAVKSYAYTRVTTANKPPTAMIPCSKPKPLPTPVRRGCTSWTWTALKTGTLAHRDVIHEICQQTQLKVEVGGGVRSEATIDALLHIGVTRAVVGTAALRNWNWFEKLMGNPTYRGRLVLGLDAREGRLAVDGWEQTTQTTATEIAARVTDWPLAAIVYTDIATDGTLEGPNIEQTRAVCEVTNVPVVASGGVGTLNDLRELRELPLQGAIIGRSLYENKINIGEALAVFEQGRQPS